MLHIRPESTTNIDIEAPHGARAEVDSTRITELNAVHDPSDVQQDSHWAGSHGTMPSSSLGDWFKRPVKIGVFQFPEGASPEWQVDPWGLYLTHPTVSPKLQGYRMWRGCLKVKALINGSPYQYCPIMMSYKPLVSPGSSVNPVPRADESYDFSGGTWPNSLTYSQVSQVGFPKLVSNSLRPHIMLYPHLCQGGEMALPFVWPLDWQEFPYPHGLDTSGRAGTGPLLSYLMGKLDIRALTPLRTCSSSADGPVTMTLFAWMEDLELTAPTVGDFVEQSMFGNSPAKVVSTVSGAAAEVGWLPSLARTGAKVVKAAADVAHALGFTRHAVIEDVKPFAVVGNMHLANTGLSIPHNVLALSPGNNLSIDPSVVAPSCEDETSFANVCGRPCVVYQFDWNSTDAPGDVLAEGPVTPENYIVVPTTGLNGRTYNQVTLSNTAQVASMHQYWRGPITYTFQVIATAFHKGRLYITWEPDALKDGFSTTYQRTEVFDISESSTHTMTVNYVRPESWLPCHSEYARLDQNEAGETGTPRWSSTGSPFIFSSSSLNGKLTVRVMNSLRSPVVDAPVTILVWASAPDIEFAFPIQPFSVPNETNLAAVTFTDPFTYQSGGPEVVSAAVGATTSVVEAGGTDKDDAVYMGEQSLSLKNLAQRCCRLLNFSFPAEGTGTPRESFFLEMPRLPYPLGLARDAAGTLTSIPQYVFGNNNAISYDGQTGAGVVASTTTFNNTLPYHYIASSYTGLRGGVEYRLVPYQDGTLTRMSMEAHRSLRRSDTVLTPTGSIVTEDPLSIPSGAYGMASSAEDETVLAVKAPLYSCYRFLSPNLTRACPDNYWDWLRFYVSKDNQSNTSNTNASLYFNVADDFTFGWYLNPSTVYISRLNYAPVTI